MGAKRAGDKAETAYEQDQHDERVEKAGGAKVDAHVGEDTGEDEEGTSDGKKPARRAATVPEEKPYAEKHGDQSEPKGVRAEKTPKGTNHTDLIGQEVSPETGHDHAEHEMAEAAGCAPDVAERTICHGLSIADCRHTVLSRIHLLRRNEQLWATSRRIRRGFVKNLIGNLEHRLNDD